jgi:prepilin-type N-terminal cleavage/methylation domain-containing protein
MGQRLEVGGAPTSRRRGGAARAGGFTLFEVIVTLFVLSLALGLALPILGRTSETLQARAHVAGFAAMLRHAREKAITTHRAHAVVVDPVARRVRIVTGTDEVREMRPLPERVRVEAASSRALTVRFEPEGTSSGGDFRVASGGVAYRVTVDPITGRVRSQRE